MKTCPLRANWVEFQRETEVFGRSKVAKKNLIPFLGKKSRLYDCILMHLHSTFSLSVIFFVNYQSKNGLKSPTIDKSIPGCVIQNDWFCSYLDKNWPYSKSHLSRTRRSWISDKSDTFFKVLSWIDNGWNLPLKLFQQTIVFLILSHPGHQQCWVRVRNQNYLFLANHRQRCINIPFLYVMKYRVKHLGTLLRPMLHLYHQYIQTLHNVRIRWHAL